MTMHESMTPPSDYERLLAVAERERAPLALRQRIEDDRGRLGQGAAIRRRLRLMGALAAGAAVAGVVVGLAVPGASSGPTVLDAAALGVKPAVAAAPARRDGHPATLDAKVGAVRFPAWGAKLQWSASGRRSDDLSGRRTETVFYRGPHATRLGYTIVDGDALPWPQGSKTVVRRGVAVHIVRQRGRLVAAWRVHGQTCVISAPGTMPERRLVALAAVYS